MELSLKGKTALVCGASRGIGAATAKELAELGARVVLLARSEDRLDGVRAELPGKGHKIMVADLGHREDLALKLKDFFRTQGKIHILVCNAGGPKGGPILEATEEMFEQAFSTHLLTNALLAQLVVPGMVKDKYGRIINIISTSVKSPIPNLGVSNTVRGAVASWAKTLAAEVGPKGITVNNILPGFTSTERLESLKEAASSRLGVSVEDVEKNWLSQVPLGRFAHPEEPAQAAAFLASPAASFITGVSLPVDGGRITSL